MMARRGFHFVVLHAEHLEAGRVGYESMEKKRDSCILSKHFAAVDLSK